jgi:hypothetical protein
VDWDAWVMKRREARRNKEKIKGERIRNGNYY